MRACLSSLTFIFALGASVSRSQPLDEFGALMTIQEQLQNLPSIILQYKEPLIDSGIKRYRFALKDDMWRLDRFDRFGKIDYTITFSGSEYYQHVRNGNVLVVTDRVSDISERHIGGICSSVPGLVGTFFLFGQAFESYKLPDIRSPVVWQEALRDSQIKRLPSEVHSDDDMWISYDNERFQGSLRIAKTALPESPAWQVLEVKNLVKENQWIAHIVFSEWRLFHLDSGATFAAPLKAVCRGCRGYDINGRRISGVSTAVLLPDTVKSLPSDTPDSAFRVPLNLVKEPFIRRSRKSSE